MSAAFQVLSWSDAADEGPARELTPLGEVEGLKTILITLRRGGALADHMVQVPISVQVLSGATALAVEGEVRPLGVGELALLAAGVRHALTETADGVATVLLSRCAGRPA